MSTQKEARGPQAFGMRPFVIRNYDLWKGIPEFIMTEVFFRLQE